GGDQRLAVGVVDGHDGDGGLAAHRVEVGSAPDGGADALVDGLPRVDEDHCDRTGGGDGFQLFLDRDTLCDNDLPPGVDAAKVDTGVEHTALVVAGTRRRVDEIAHDLFAVSGHRHRDRLGAERAAVGPEGADAG